MTDPVREYAEAVLSGAIVAGKPVRQACERHLRDLEEGGKRGLVWSLEKAMRVFQFFGFLCLPETDFEVKPFILQPWQQFILGSLFGWLREDGTRRFRTGYCEVGKGNGKSPVAAGVGLYGEIADGESGAEIYSSATMRDQAKILWTDACRMVQASPSLARRFKVSGTSITIGGSTFKPVSSEHRGLDGKRVHMALIDELHEHPTSMVVDKMRAGTKGRRQALIFEITNSGFDRHSICRQHHDYSLKVLEGSQPDDSWFAYVCQLDEGDDWKNDPGCWLKANPNLGVSIQPRYLEERVAEAKGMPSSENIVARLNFCVWTEQNTRAIPMDLWKLCTTTTPDQAMAWRKQMIASLRGRDCWAGLDLGATSDLCAFVLWFPGDDEDKDILLPWFWIPKDSIWKRSQRDQVPYDVWEKQGWIKPAGHASAAYPVIRADINELGEHFRIREIAVDRLFQGAQLSTELMDDGHEVVTFGQGFFSMAAPVKRFLELVADGKIDHGCNPILTWMAGNTAAREDPAGNQKWDKEQSSEKIDGIVAATMALGRVMVATGNTEEEWFANKAYRY